MVAVQLRRFSGLEGKAEMEGVGCIMRVMSSVWRLEVRLVVESRRVRSGGT